MTDADIFFYFTASVLMLLVWALFSFGSGGFSDFHRRALNCRVATVPSWLPAWILTFILRRKWMYLSLCHGTPVVMLLAAVSRSTSSRWVRIGLASLLSVYGLVENSVTLSHRDFLNAYCAWCLALLEGPFLAAATLGCCVHFVFSSGYGKLTIAGGRQWGLDGDCLGGILRSYGKLSLADGGPLSSGLNSILSERSRRGKLLSSMLASATLLFECVLVPLVLALPPGLRRQLPIHMVLLHVGIALAQSGGIGIAFLPNVAGYVLGAGNAAGLVISYSLSSSSSNDLSDGSDPIAPVFASGPWFLAIIIGLTTPLYHAATQGSLLPENWPLSPFALFPWSSLQWEELFRRFVDGETRLVLATASLKHSKMREIYVVKKYGSSGEWGGASLSAAGSSDLCFGMKTFCYDAWDILVGETIIHHTIVQALFHAGGIGFSDDMYQNSSSGSSLQIQKHLHAPSAGATNRTGSLGWDSFGFCRDVEAWLNDQQRLIEVESGKPLLRCYFARVDPKTGLILKIISHGGPK